MKQFGKMCSNRVYFGLGVEVFEGVADVQAEAFPENCPCSKRWCWGEWLIWRDKRSNEGFVGVDEGLG